MIVSWAATVDKDDGGGAARRQVMVNDVSRAYFYAERSRDMYIELPPEDPHHGEGFRKAQLVLIWDTRCGTQLAERA